jgi:hypothetical protein
MLPALSAPERAAVLAGVRAGAPAGAYEGILRVAREVLSEEDWRRLETELATAA